MKQLHVLIAALLLLTSCATYNGTQQGSASLSQPNFRYAGSVYGTVDAVYFLGIGGHNHQTLLNEARANMQQQFPLRNGLALANVSTETKNSYFFPIVRKRIIITADVVDFWPDTIQTYQHGGYYLNDSVFLSIPPLGKAMDYALAGYNWYTFAKGDGVVMTINGKATTATVVERVNAFRILCRYTDDVGNTRYIMKEPRLLNRVEPLR